MEIEKKKQNLQLAMSGFMIYIPLWKGFGKLHHLGFEGLRRS